MGEAWVYWTLLMGAGQPQYGVMVGGAAGPRVEEVVGNRPAAEGGAPLIRRYSAAASAGIRTVPLDGARRGVGGVGPDGGLHLLDASLERRLRSQMEELARRQQMIAKLVEQSER